MRVRAHHRGPVSIRFVAGLSGLALAATSLPAQTFRDLSLVRNPQVPYSSLFLAEAGLIGTMASDKVPAAGLDDELTWDGRVYYHDEQFGENANEVDFYAGKDGVLASIRDGRIVGDTISRLQLAYRPWQFYREGYYGESQQFFPTGRYEGSDYEAFLGFGRQTAENLFVEIGPMYRQRKFERTDVTAPLYVIPDDYSAYGSRIYVEQSTLQLDRRSGMPRSGYQLTILAEREWNNSDTTIGPDEWKSTLPSAVWRGDMRLEWYLPQGSDSAWEIFAHGAWRDQKDRVANYESGNPPGSLWVDAQLRYRLPLGDSITLSPFAHGQYVNVLQQDGQALDKEFFWGGGFEGWMHFSETISMHAYYSFLDNESRPTVSVTEDIHAEHMFYLGLVMRLGAGRR